MEREKRRKGKKSDSRQSALERLKASRKTGIASYEVDDVENIFDEVSEADYQVCPGAQNLSPRHHFNPCLTPFFRRIQSLDSKLLYKI